ncbi:hypothetical protein LAZ67_13001950 [Cordylochernes scorpioides]|uniref:Arylsulfatase B n=1 Tax=Cordylochernes scorpioides TaxID=51811 RepID=A0ABY6L879_9ARAC|nr:hypothetical protein LAZ67_13001950 [Cordylochernes scorpioides]
MNSISGKPLPWNLRMEQGRKGTRDKVPRLRWNPLQNKISCYPLPLVSHQYIIIWKKVTTRGVTGGNISTLGQLDGLSQWEALSSGKSGPRTEILLNIDPVWKMSALRVGPYKVISGDYDSQWSGWYGPAGSNDTSRYDVQCGPKGSTCNPVEAACLFNIEEDPCEMNNLADEKPQMVAEMLQRVAEYAKKAVPPLNKPFDPQANPALHGYFWSPWRDSPDM